MARFAASSPAMVLVVMLAGGLGAVPEVIAESVIEEGKRIATDRRKGNCMSCHMMDGTTLPGNIGPPLIAMKARFPDKAKLRAQIWDSTQFIANSLMPPFGRHEVLTEDEIDKVVEYIHSL